MSAILVVSILVQLAALSWSLAIYWRLGNRRVLIVIALLASILAANLFTFISSWPVGSAFTLTMHLRDVPALFISLLAFLLAMNLEGMFAAGANNESAIDSEGRGESEALRLSEERYRVIVETSGEGIYLCEFDEPMSIDLPEEEQIRRLSTECHFSICNDAFARMYGYQSGDQMIGKRAIDCYRTHENESNVEFLRRLIHGGYHVTDLISEEFDREGNRVVFSNNCLGIVRDNHLIRVWGTQRDITEQTLARKRIADSERRYRQLVDNAPYCIHEIELDGRISSMNQAGLSLLGLTDGSGVFGADYLSLVSEEDRPRIEKTLNDAKQGKSVHFEFRATGGNLFDSSFIPLADAQGRVERIMGISQDVSDRKRAQVLILSENAILEGIAKGQPRNDTLRNLISFIESQTSDLIASVLVLDEDGIHLRHAVSTGLPESYVQAVDGIEIGPLVGSCGTAAYTGEAVFVDDIATDPRWASYRRLAAEHSLAACWSTPIKDHLGKVLGTLAIYRKQPGPCSQYDRKLIEISTHLAAVTISRHQSEAARRHSDNRFRMIFEQAAVGVAVLDSTSGLILQVNRRYCEILGMQEDELVGKTWMELTHPDDLAADSAKMMELREGRIRDFSIEKRLRRKDETFAWINLSVSGLWEPGELATTHIAIVEDITERKEAQQEIQLHRDTLAHVTRLSTMGELMAGIAHEVRQPLYAVSNFATAAAVTLQDLDSKIPGSSDWLVELKDWNHGVREASQRASEIIERLRAFARKADGIRESFNLNEVVRDSIELIAFEAREGNTEVELNLESALPNVIGDRIQCEQVVVNLLRNAYEAIAAKSSPGRVSVRTHSQDGFVETTIEDNGPGIGAEQSGKLFEAFYTTKTDGMGMGLAISRTIVEDHDGRLWIEDSKCGAEFHFSLPVAVDHSAALPDDLLEQVDSV